MLKRRITKIPKRLRRVWFGDDLFRKPRSERWDEDLALIADLRPNDHVLDMGCAQGDVTLEVAKRVAYIHGVELLQRRIDAARKNAAELGIENATFEVGSVIDYPLQTKSYDVVLLLSVLGKKTDTGFIGLDTLVRMLDVARRQIYIRCSFNSRFESRGLTLQGILTSMRDCGFEGVCFPCTQFKTIIVGNRLGTDATIAFAPPFILIPTAQIISGVRVGTCEEFGIGAPPGPQHHTDRSTSE